MERGTSAGIRTGIWGKLKLVPYLSYWKLFLIRVAEGLGLVRNSDISRDLFKLYWSWGIIQRNELKLCILPEAGRLENVVSGVPFISKSFSLFGGIDAIQSVALNQPFVGGNIAPNEKMGLVNPNGGTRSMSHTPINYSAADPWSVIFVANWNGTKEINAYTIGQSASNYPSIMLKQTANNIVIRSLNGDLYQLWSNLAILGKNSIITIVYDVVYAYLYINGLFINKIAYLSSFKFDVILKAQDNLQFNGRFNFHSIKSIALSPIQVKSEADLLRSYFPEIPSVVIGTQVWATSNLDVVCTPQGNLIYNITPNSNGSNINVTPDFNEWSKSGTVTIDSPSGFTTGINGAGVYRGYIIGDSCYKVIISGNSTVPFKVQDTSSSLFKSIEAGAFNETFYFKKVNSNNIFIVLNTPGTISSVSFDIVAVGWSDSQNLYNYIYANTTGTTEQKTYAAVKAAAMWSYYNNDASIGAVYGKLYNWYAVKLLQMDIDYYNAANPSTPWGWRIPTRADFTTLQTTLGGSSVAGGKMKKEGLTYWGSPNTGANNESGFSALGSGARTMSFVNFNTNNGFWSITESASTLAFEFYNTKNDSIFSQFSFDKNYGLPVRLIKS